MKKITSLNRPWHKWFLVAAICSICTQAYSQWSLTGNTGTVPGTNFIGTTDSKAFYIKTKNATRVAINSSGRVGIGTTAPVFKLDVKGGSINTDSLFRINGVQVLSRDALNNLQLGDATAKIGIGTTTPESRFHIVGSADATQIILDANFTQNNTNPLIKLRNYAGIDILWVHSDNVLNTFVGVNAGRLNYANGGATYNSFIGSNAGYSNTSGNYNTANGTNALYYNTTGSTNTAFGSYALYSNVSGYWNVANGESALRNNTSGHSNTASGINSLYNNTTGYFNTATGTSVLVNNSTGFANTGSGYQALLYNTIGSSNTAGGNKALFYNTSGNYNTANGNVSLYLNTTGTGNTGNGHYTLYSNSTGSYNSSLGYGAGCNPNQNPSNFTAIGYNAGHAGGNSNTIEIGNTSITWISGQVGWSLHSDKRIKDNIQSNVPGLSFITKLNPVTYNLNIHKQHEICGIIDTNEWEGKYDIEKIVQTGFLAQEVEQAAKECNYDFNGVRAPIGNAKLYSVQYSSFVMPLVKAVQELNKTNEELKIKNAKLENKVEAIEKVLSSEQKLQLGINNSVSQGQAILFQNNPNPFNQTTVIRFALSSEHSNGVINIRDLSGNLVKSIVINNTGRGQVTINAKEFTQGTYTYSLEVAGESVDTKLMVITK